MRSAPSETFETSPCFPLTSRFLFDVFRSFCSVPSALLVFFGGGAGGAFFDLSVMVYSVDDGILTNGVPSARVNRRGSGQDCCGTTGS